jgi:hypothetical protein
MAPERVSEADGLRGSRCTPGPATGARRDQRGWRVRSPRVRAQATRPAQAGATVRQRRGAQAGREKRPPGADARSLSRRAEVQQTAALGRRQRTSMFPRKENGPRPQLLQSGARYLFATLGNERMKMSPHWTCENCGARLYSASESLRWSDCPVCASALSKEAQEEPRTGSAHPAAIPEPVPRSSGDPGDPEPQAG